MSLWHGRVIVVIFIVSLCVWNVEAWGASGHQIVAEIAERHLTRRAYHQLRPLLELLDNADGLFSDFFPDGYTHVREGERLSLSDVAVAADTFKKSKNGMAKRYRSGEKKVNIYEATAPLHFVNRMPGNDELDFVKACPQHMKVLCDSEIPQAPFDTWPCCGQCITAALPFYKEVLYEPANREQASIALLFIIHLVADIHQPLHAGFADDRGGNEVLVYNRRSQRCETLHEAWDTSILEHFLSMYKLTPLTYAEDLYKSMKALATPEDTAFQPRLWAQESDHVLIHEHAREAEEMDGVPSAPPGERGPLHFSSHTGDIYWRLKNEEQVVCPRKYVLAPQIGSEYEAWAMTVINRRLFYAGVRLGAMLNDMFDGDLFWRLPKPTKDIPVRKDHNHSKKRRKYRHDEL